MSRAWDEGYDACESGRGKWACPYKRGTHEFDEWQAGWLSADRNKRGL